MIKKKSFTSAFTLIELLVVITIIGILASIALPVFSSVQIRAAQTKVLAQAKQVALALKSYASDNGGTYPVQGTATNNPAYSGGTPAAGNYSNKDFFPLFPTYVQVETIFANKYNYYNHVVPDNVIDAAGSAQSKTLAAGENSFSYFEGLTDSLPASLPLVMDGGTATGTYTSAINTAGYDFGNNKVVVVHLDNSASLDTCTAAVSGSATTYTDNGTDPTNTGTSTKINILNPTAYTALSGVQLAIPQY